MLKKTGLVKLISLVLVLIVTMVAAGCSSNSGAEKPAEEKKKGKTINLTISSCCVTEDVTTKEIIPAFQAYWKEKTGENVEFASSYAGSGSLTNAIVGGTPVEVAVLSSELYAHQIEEKGLTSTDWRSLQNNGVVIKSAIVFLVREGNPKGIKTFADLTEPGVEVLHSNPDTSGGAQWAIFSIYGSALKETEVKYGKADKEKAFDLLNRVEANVISMPESAKQAAAQFEAGLGDVLITYENEALLELDKGKKYEMVIPQSTIETDWTVVKVDKNITPGNEEVVDAFIEFLFSDFAQDAYASYGFRSIVPEITARYDKYAEVDLPFNIEYLGGVKEARKNIIDDLWKKTQR